MEIVRTKAFDRSIKRLGVTAEELNALFSMIAADPEAGVVIKGLGGVRKLRFAYGAKGKRGGGRAIYIVVRTEDSALMLLAYGKNEQADLSRAQRKALAQVVKELSK